MGATGRNIVKLITGSAVGAGVGALLTRGAGTAAKRQEAVVVIPSTSSRPDAIGVTTESTREQKQNKISEIRDSLRARWERAKEEGDKAKEAREAELRAYFREKVNDPTAFPPGAPTRTDR